MNKTYAYVEEILHTRLLCIQCMRNGNDNKQNTINHITLYLITSMNKNKYEETQTHKSEEEIIYNGDALVRGPLTVVLSYGTILEIISHHDDGTIKNIQCL